MTKNSNLDLLDLLNILSFVIGLANYGENITQGDMQEVAEMLNQKTSAAVDDLHRHLQEQDDKIEKILGLLKGEAE